MRKYKVVEVKEKELEEMVRIGANLIEEGLRYIDHQKRTERGPLDVLFADSGNALVVAELKVVQDDEMLVQGLDYYDDIASNIEGYARAYKEKKIDPIQKLRLFLIAPSFSVPLLKRCKWIDVPLSLFTFQCLVFEDNPKEIVPVFKEITIPSKLQPVEVYTIEKRLNYITDGSARKIAEELIEEIQAWDKDNILIEPIKYSISMKVAGRVFAYLDPRRKFFIVWTYSSDDKWTDFPIKQPDDLNQVKTLLKDKYEYYKERK